MGLKNLILKIDTTLDGKLVVRQYYTDTENREREAVYLEYNNAVIILSVYKYSSENVNIFNQILSTFKFIETNETAGWKTYVDSLAGISFKHPSNWGLWSSEALIPFSIYSVNIDELEEECSGLGLCQQGVRNTEERINNGTIENLIEFSDGKGYIRKNCTVEGAPPLSPWYGVYFIKDNKWVEVQVTDYGTIWPITDEGVEDCISYINRISIPNKVDSPNYKIYNDFITIIQSTLKFIE